MFQRSSASVARWGVFFIAVAAVTVLALVPRGDGRLQAQTRMVSLVAQDNGHAALGLALRRLNVVGTFLQTAAHPDDEHNQLYALLTLGQGLRSVDVQTTRGEGGQNEIGPELFRDMGVLRTSELLSAHRLDGAEQWFARSIDFGYSFDPPEIYTKWGRHEVAGDFVRFIRATRPDVVLTMTIQGRGGDRAHESTAVLTQEAYRAAADPKQFPEQIQAGLRPWQARKLYFTGGTGVIGGPPVATAAPPAAVHVTTANTAAYDPLLGRTYQEIGVDARSNHKCQGMGQLPPLAGGIGGGRGGGPAGPSRYRLMESTIAAQLDKDETSLFDGIDTSLIGLASFAGANPPEALKTGLAAIAEQAQRAQKAFDSGDDAGTAAPAVAGLNAIRALRAQLGSLGLSESARYEIDFRLKTKEADYENAVFLAYGLAFEALADDGLVTPGQPVKLSLVVANRGASQVAVTGVSATGFDGSPACAPGTVNAGAAFTCSADARVPSDAKLTEPYWTDQYWDTRPPKAALNIYAPDVEFGLPFRPSPFRVTFRMKVGGAEIDRQMAVQYRYPKDIFVGEKRMELNVVPALSVKTTPATAVIPAVRAAGGGSIDREIFVSVTSGTKGAAQAAVALELPPGWTAAPATAALSFANEDESLTTRFKVSIPATVKVGEYLVRAVVTSAATGAARFTNGYQEIDYPHIQRRQVIKPAETDLKVIDARIAPNVRVGYVVGAGDQVPPAIEQLGAKVAFIQPDELAWGDLSRYDVIVTGVRAYLKRSDLRAYNRRLIEFAERGGTVIVQYNKMEFNQAQFGPFPAKVGSGRVTDENAAVKVLVPGHPAFTFPNKITEATWKGWVQERGLYFLGEKDARYVDLISMEDSFPDNPGEKLGSLVDARIGKGHWIYLGLGLWRQLPAQTEGAYQLLANLISLPKAPAAAPAAPAGVKRH
jgi:LmbE family N-acetylglucosaminyl deacetylase